MADLKRIGKYEIIKEIGRGGFAIVYKAQDPDLDRVVALKVLAPHLTWDPTFANRFRREAQATANLRHPNIVTIHEVGQDGDQLYIAMEYLPGCSLAELLKAKGAVPLESALPILAQLAHALDYAHKERVIHRDVKPSNVMVEETERGVHATLMDFGLVKAMESSESLTSAGVTLGSPEYMAPEQADPDRKSEIGPSTDRYALGIVAYEMLTGRVPFPGSTPSTLVAHMQKAPPDPQSIRKTLPASVAQVLLKSLSKSAGERYPKAMAMVEALRQAETDTLAIEHERQPAPKQETVWGWVALGVLALALLVTGALLGSGLGKTAPELTVETAVAAKATDTPVVTGTPTATDTRLVAKVPTKTATKLAATDTPSPTSTPTATATDTTIPSRTPTAAPTATPTRTAIPTSTIAVESGVHACTSPEEQYEICWRNPDGTVTNLTNNPDGFDGYPNVSPDGTKIYFETYRKQDGNFEVYVMNSDGSKPTNLTSSPGHDGEPDLSPDGTQIAYTCSFEICVMNVDGSDKTKLTDRSDSQQPGHPTQSDERPEWSPDGTRIAFMSGRDGNLEIYVMNADGSGQTNLTNHPADDWLFEWLPDGRIFFMREGCPWCVMNADGSEVTQVEEWLGGRQ